MLYVYRAVFRKTGTIKLANNIPNSFARKRAMLMLWHISMPSTERTGSMPNGVPVTIDGYRDWGTCNTGWVVACWTRYLHDQMMNSKTVGFPATEDM